MKRPYILLLLSSMAFGQGVVVPTQQALKVVNGITSPVANATITVCAANVSGIPCAPVLGSAVFKDAALTQPQTNPFTSDANGNYLFAIAPGNYTVTVTGAGFAGYSYQTTAPVVASANNTFTGTTIFSGAANLNGGGALVGTFSGPTTISSGSSPAGPLVGTVASGTATMTTASIAAVSGTTITCGTTVTVSATGVANTDVVSFSPVGAPVSPNTGLIIQGWTTANNVNFFYCNPTASALTPVAETLNWRVSR